MTPAAVRNAASRGSLPSRRMAGGHPLDRPFILSVAASDRNDQIVLTESGTGGSRGDETFDLAAPGIEMPLLTPGRDGLVIMDGDVVLGGGSSFSVPLVSGTAALMLSQCPALAGRPVDLKRIIVQSANCGIDGLEAIDGCRLNVGHAVRAVSPGLGTECPP